MKDMNMLNNELKNNGICLGLNVLNRDMFLDKKKINTNQNPNEVVFGVPRSGMSFYAISDILSNLSILTNKTYFLDPKHEC